MTDIPNQLLDDVAKRLRAIASDVEHAIVRPQRGVFMVRSEHGYDVQVDGTDLKLDLHYGEAFRLATEIGIKRAVADERGFGCPTPEQAAALAQNLVPQTIWHKLGRYFRLEECMLAACDDDHDDEELEGIERELRLLEAELKEAAL